MIYTVILTDKQGTERNLFFESMIAAARYVTETHDNARALGLSQGRDYEVSLLSEVAS